MYMVAEGLLGTEQVRRVRTHLIVVSYLRSRTAVRSGDSSSNGGPWWHSGIFANVPGCLILIRRPIQEQFC